MECVVTHMFQSRLVTTHVAKLNISPPRAFPSRRARRNLDAATDRLKFSVDTKPRDNYRVCPQEAWHCGGKAEYKRSEMEATHTSTSEGFVDPWYYQLSELTGYTYFTKQSTCHVLTAFGFTYEPKFLHEAP